MVFKISPAVQPTDLDAALEERGYRFEAPTSVQIAELAGIPAADDNAVTLESHPAPSWIADFRRLTPYPSGTRRR